MRRKELRHGVRYSEAFKLEVVMEAEEGVLNFTEIAQKYCTKGPTMIQRWIAHYGSGVIGKAMRVEKTNEIDQVQHINSAGSIVESYDYDAYGNVTIKDGDGNGNIITSSAYSNRFLFQGREYDYTTQLYNFRARWYDPETGRWLSNDPIGISGGLNLYAFCGNNPVCFVDPMGNFSFIPAIVGAVIGGIVGGVTEALEGGDLGDIVKGAAIGAISGGASGLTLGLGNFITVGAVSGAVGSAVSDALNQAVAINSGEQCEYDGLETFYDGIIGGFGGLIGGGISNCLTPRFLNKCVVSSWADDGPADLLPGRWVMIGGATWDNKILSGRIFYSNSVSCEVNSSTLSLPPSWEVVKSALGQFRLK